MSRSSAGEKGASPHNEALRHLIWTTAGRLDSVRTFRSDVLGDHLLTPSAVGRWIRNHETPDAGTWIRFGKPSHRNPATGAMEVTWEGGPSTQSLAAPVVAGTQGTGGIASGFLEMSNVDLTREFTDMIVNQRGFQANSRIITTSDEMLQDLLALKR